MCKFGSLIIYVPITYSVFMFYLFRCLLSLPDSELLLSSSVCLLFFFFLLLCFLLFFCFFFTLQLCNESSLPSLDSSSVPVNTLAGPEQSVALTQKTDKIKVSHSVTRCDCGLYNSRMKCAFDTQMKHCDTLT